VGLRAGGGPAEPVRREKGSFCFTCPYQLAPWLAKQAKAKKVGVLSYRDPLSADCTEGLRAAFEKYP
jgi:hypothetical protein